MAAGAAAYPVLRAGDQVQAVPDGAGRLHRGPLRGSASIQGTGGCGCFTPSCNGGGGWMGTDLQLFMKAFKIGELIGYLRKAQGKESGCLMCR